MAAPSSPTFDDVDITGALAIAGWASPDGQTRFLYSSTSDPSHQVTFDLHFSPLSPAASFRLRVPIMLKGLGRHVSPLYLTIPPERILSLSDGASGDVPDDVQKRLGTSIITLRFGLKQTSDLVTPQHNPLTPKNKIYGDVLDSLRLLAKETSFTIYFVTGSLPEERLRPLWEAVSTGTLTSSAPDADIGRLYNGKGGRVLEDGTSVAVAPTDSECPPLYNDIGPSAPLPPEKQGKLDLETSVTASTNACKFEDAGPSESSRKRPRSASDAVDSMQTSHVETMCRKIMNEMTAEWRQEREQVRFEIRDMETRLMQWMDKRLGECTEELREEAQQSSLQREHAVDEQIQEVKDETDDLIDVRLDERMVAVKVELEEYVEEQIDDAEERLMGRLRTANVSIEFKIDE